MRFWDFVDRANAALEKRRHRPKDELTTESPPASVLIDNEIERIKRLLADLRRRNLEYFDVIERIERERDGWKERFFTQSSQHQTAQAMLERRGGALARQVTTLLAAINKMRKEVGDEPIAPSLLPGLPDQISSEAYGERMKKLGEEMPPPVDGKAEREVIAGSDA